MKERFNHTDIRLEIIKASYEAIKHLQGILSEPILRQDYEDDDLGPEKFLAAVRAKKQAQIDAFEMLANIESAQSQIDALNKVTSKKQNKVNESSKGFAETRAT